MKPFAKHLTALFLAAGLALPAAALARPGGHHRGPGGPNPAKMVKMLERHADELGIDDATVKTLQVTVEQNRDAMKALRADVEQAHQAVRAAMEADTPDKAEVLRLVEQAGLAKIALEQQRAALMLDLRAQLTPTQQAAIKSFREAKRAEWKAKRGEWKGKRKGGKFGPDAE